MTIIGAYIFPHGTITLDPQKRDFLNIPAVKPNSRDECIKLHEAMASSALALVRSKPDLIILSTPHGLRLINSFLFMGNAMAQGNAEWDGDWKDYEADMEIDQKITQDIFDNLQEQENSVELLKLGATTETLGLKWGEAVPLWFIQEATKSENFTKPKFVYLGQPRDSHKTKAIPQTLKFGQDFAAFLHEKYENQKVAIVVSGDLSHYHSKDPTSPYKFNEKASVFDDAVVNWAKIDIDNKNNEDKNQSEDWLVDKAGSIIEEIGSCGDSGLLWLHGVLWKYSEITEDNFKSNFGHYSAPTYYGMISNYWINQKNQ